ncbi:hypothetical protein TBLA_0I02050 [Henningerozyma blattae CBS 6284]|uniref:UDP-N-acetylglucosamine transferase subunit ALG14 n=1 Tax=Henningerozyma blattae (strain ATCC 34711 / CBS 6284 / DSM 70876 / NBRC 10599 / NRRL Y-10934 / UCD 77-7) TaxID=1071380 RepID=I2H911_HENB6|nr:hypothetical protein TBLA_0I02050 [Tetrapisispora blattae CBS 6284]CCH62863.1 hypothetical protein TBLA_0I02050 [Tetrapisispora blattae CBS 6284]
MLVILSAISLILFALVITRLILILPFFKVDRNGKERQALMENGNKAQPRQIEHQTVRQKDKPLHLFVFLGSGGHTGEMLRILQNYDSVLFYEPKNEGTRIQTILYLGYSDLQSLEKFKDFISNYKYKNNMIINYVQFIKARNVNANMINSLISISKTLFYSFKQILRIKLQMLNNPHLVLLNGPGTCCIITLWFKVFEFFLIGSSSNIVYVESLARITSLSMTGKILYYLADKFVVQWEDLKQTICPRALYYGILV